ncbi:MAG: META domain-containing protein [Tannerella sp.]|jgi:heat shock protein HslJ|nr:META domain-containing protein [Tannerella sp.]
MKVLLYLCATTTLLLCGCKSSQNASSAFSPLDGEWEILSLKDCPLQAGRQQPTVRFDAHQGRVSAYAGCNRMSGRLVKAKKGSLQIQGMASTRMACMDMRAEDALSKVLSQAASYRIGKDGQLLVYDGEKQELLSAKRKGE